MKKSIVILVTLVSLLFAGCKNDSSMAGTAVLEPTDKITVREDTFPLLTLIDTCDYVISSPDSFLLGERKTEYGTIKADILTQMACPEGYSYPENVVFDSMRIYIFYTSCVGSERSPLSINMYEMDKQTLEYNPNPKYKTNEDVSRFCSLDDSTRILSQERIVVAEHHNDSTYFASLDAYLPVVSFSVDPNSAFFKRFTSHTSYGSQIEFNEHILKGLYITTDFGSSTVLNVSNIGMIVNYHFTYERFDGEVVTETGEKSFYSNSEVKQLNRYIYEDRASLLQTLKEDSLYNYLVAPAGVYTYIDLPMRQMYDTILGEERYTTHSAYVNLAQLKVMVNHVNASSPLADQVLLIKCGNNNSRLHSFFENKELPSDTVAVLGFLTTSVDAVGNTIYYYAFDISTMLTGILHTNPQSLQDDDLMLRMALVPVSTITSTNSNGATRVVSIKEAQTISATPLYSTKNPAAQTTLQVVSSLFFKDY
ncbi:MAG: DUF4270 domain-containing protein [Paludibacteraceae bacterium]|nr:DUF4270 domain-containing protein [Paludibacteraceae bacterium]